MTTPDHSPFALAQMLRNLAQARARQHPVALDIDAHAASLLPDTHAAVWFDQLQAGNLRCTFEPPPGTPPCTADATVAVSQEPDNPDGHIDLSCLQHLAHFITPGTSHSCPVGPKRPNLRHYARSLQAAQRHPLYHPNPVPNVHAQIRYLKGHLRCRLRPC